MKTLFRAFVYAISIWAYLSILQGRESLEIASIPDKNTYKAYVLLGDCEGLFIQSHTAAAAIEAKKDFENAGYSVVFKSDAIKQDVIDALNDPSIRALWIVGHGGFQQLSCQSGCCSNSNSIPYVGLNDNDFLIPSDIENLPGISFLKYFSIHSCYQDRDEWKNILPATVHFKSWKKRLRWPVLRLYQKWVTYSAPNYCIDLNPQVDPPEIDESIGQINQYIYDPINIKYYDDLGPIANYWKLSDDISNALGNNRTFNFFIVNSGQIEDTLFGVKIVDGMLDQENSISYNAYSVSESDFNVMFTLNGFINVLQYPNSYDNLVFSNDI